MDAAVDAILSRARLILRIRLPLHLPSQPSTTTPPSSSPFPLSPFPSSLFTLPLSPALLPIPSLSSSFLYNGRLTLTSEPRPTSICSSTVTRS